MDGGVRSPRDPGSGHGWGCKVPKRSRVRTAALGGRREAREKSLVREGQDDWAGASGLHQ